MISVGVGLDCCICEAGDGGEVVGGGLLVLVVGGLLLLCPGVQLLLRPRLCMALQMCVRRLNLYCISCGCVLLFVWVFITEVYVILY